MGAEVGVKCLPWVGCLIPRENLQACSTILSGWLLTAARESSTAEKWQQRAEIEQVSSVWMALSSVLCTINHPPNLVLIISGQRREWTEHSYQAPSVVLKTWPPHGDELGTNLILTGCFGHTHSVLVRKTDQD